MRQILLSVFSVLLLPVMAQFERKENALVTIRGNVGIPKPISSKMFRTAFNGIFEANLSVNYRLFNNFHLGLGYQNSYFQNNKEVFVYYKVPPKQATSGGSLSYNTRLMGHCGYLRIGYDRFFSDKGYMSYALHSGLMEGLYQNVVADSSVDNKPTVRPDLFAPYLQPEMTVNFIVDRTLSFSIMVSYTTLLYKFDPKAPRFNHIEQVRNSTNRYLMSWFNIGFGFTVLINNKNQR
jgi:hypothetical protein